MAKGFFTDTTVCIGCKACQVACHQWNEIPAKEGGRVELSGNSYDNTERLSAVDWRHVRFIEQFPEDRAQTGHLQGSRWLMMSDVCKHCVKAGCLEVCPTGAIIRTEFDSVYIQQDVCNGCRACVAACPFHVVDMGADGMGCVSEARIPVSMVMEVPMRTYQGHAIVATGASVGPREGTQAVICRAKTMKVMTAIPVAMPMIASRWTARFQRSARKKPPSSPP